MSDVIRCHEPATRALLGVVHVDGPEDVRAGVQRAQHAQQAWARTSFEARRRTLRGILNRVLDDLDGLCERIVRESGKTREHALLGEVWPICEKLRWTIANGERHLRSERVSSGLLIHKSARIEFHPLGVIGAIVAWNYPFQNVLGPVVPALMAGNACVVKPSEWSAWSAASTIEIVRRALSAEGHSPELVQLVQGYPETGQSLIEAGIDSLVFIGSVRNGRSVLATAAARPIPAVVELGGKDPFIVCDDADIEHAVHAALAGCFISAGQNCIAPERVLVIDAVHDQFARRAADLVATLRQGPPGGSEIVDVGAMATPEQLEIVERLVARALEQGARALVGGHRVLAERGDFFAPTVLADITPEMDIMRDETFGPVMLLCRVRDDDHAIEVANQTGFGLSSSVFSRDRARARRIARSVHAGMSAINDFGGLTYMAQDLPFGGVKASGFGRMNGREGLRACCNLKAVLDDRVPMRVAAKVLPVRPGDFARAKGTLRVVYGSGLLRRLRGLADVALER